MKWYLRACPTCSGDLHDVLDEHGWLECLMCGREFRARRTLELRPETNDWQHVNLLPAGASVGVEDASPKRRAVA
jgi:hypothetical protein